MALFRRRPVARREPAYREPVAYERRPGLIAGILRFFGGVLAAIGWTILLVIVVIVLLIVLL